MLSVFEAVVLSCHQHEKPLLNYSVKKINCMNA